MAASDERNGWFDTGMVIDLAGRDPRSFGKKVVKLLSFCDSWFVTAYRSPPIGLAKCRTCSRIKLNLTHAAPVSVLVSVKQCRNLCSNSWPGKIRLIS